MDTNTHIFVNHKSNMFKYLTLILFLTLAVGSCANSQSITSNDDNLESFDLISLTGANQIDENDGDDESEEETITSE